MTSEALLEQWRVLARRLARRSLALRPAPIVAITGSVGKSTTTAFVAQLLSVDRRVQVTEDNMNLGWAIASTLLGQRYTRKPARFFRQLPKLLWRGLIKPQPVDVFVLEVATNYPGDIPASLTAFRPSIAVYTTITNAHVGNFASAAALFQEKAAVIDALPDTGLAVLNYDDEGVRALASRHQGPSIFYGFNPRSDVWMSEPRVDETGQHVTLSDPDGALPLTFPSLKQRHHLYAVMAAWAVGRSMGLSRERMADQVQGFAALPGRGRALEGIMGTLIFDDCHNSSPVATVAAIESLALLGAGRRKVAVLGDMKELGTDTDRAHFEVGQAAGHGADLVVAVGECGDRVADGFASVSGRTAHRYDNVDACIGALDQWLTSGDVVLVKGSHSINLHRLVKRLHQNGRK